MLPEDDIVLLVLFFLLKRFWYILALGACVLFYVITNYPVFLWAGIGAWAQTTVGVLTAQPAAETGAEAENGAHYIHAGTQSTQEGIDCAVQVEQEIFVEERPQDAEHTCRKLPDDREPCPRYEVLRRENQAIQQALDQQQQQQAEMNSRADDREPCPRCEALGRENEALQQALRQQQEQAEMNSRADIAEASGGAPEAPAAQNANPDRVNVRVCDGTHDCGHNHLIAQLDWQLDVEREKSDRLQHMLDQMEHTCEDLRIQVEEKQTMYHAGIRRLVEEFQQAVQREQDSFELEQLCNQYRRELRQLRRRYDQIIPELERRLDEAKRRGQHDVDRLKQQQDEERRREHQNVMKFVLALENRVAHMVNILEAKQLQEVAEELQRVFNIRLLAVDNELNFVCEASTADWARLVEQQAQIQSVIERAIPEEAGREDLQWQDLQECPADVDLRLCESLPAGIAAIVQRGQTSASGSGAPVAVSESFVPRRATVDFSVPTRTESDGDNTPNICALLDDPTAQRVFIADTNNNKIKFASLAAPDDLGELVLPEGVGAMCRLRENVLAVIGLRAITLLDVTDRPVVMETVYTQRYYYGIAKVDDDTLVVSCHHEGDVTVESGDDAGLPARVDIIKADGQLVRTVVDSTVIPDLRTPSYLCVVGQDVLISDESSDCLFRVDLESGQLIAALRNPQLLHHPCQVSCDGAGNIYVASRRAKCVLMLSPDGEWKQLLIGYRHGEGGSIFPWGVCVMGQYLLVSWDDQTRHNSVVKGYLLS